MLLDDAQVQAASDLLVAAREGRLDIGGLPPELTPESSSDVQRIIEAVSERVDRPVRGWKTYCLYKPMNPPFFAPIYEAFGSGDTIPADISPHRLIEPEIMFRVDRDLPARDTNYGVAELMDAVTAVVGFEIIGSRYRGGEGQGSYMGSMADHIANGCIVVGDTIPHWRDVAFEEVSLRMTEDDRELVSVVGCHPFDNPFLPVVAGINRIRRRHAIDAGAIIVTNSSTSYFPVSAGTVVRAVYDDLGEVSATFAAT